MTRKVISLAALFISAAHCVHLIASASAQGPNATTPLPPSTTKAATTPTTTTTSTTTTTTTTTTASTSTTTEGPVVIPIQGCWKKGKLYRVGESIPGTTDCETCYCSPRGPTCQRIECPPVALDCDPVIPRGHCCPTEYICNKTQFHRDDYKALGLDKNLYHAQGLPDDYKDTQPLPRKSDDTSDYNAVPQPAYRPPTTQETAPQDRTITADKSVVLHKDGTQPPTRTTTIMPVTRFAPTPVTKEKDVFVSVTDDVKEVAKTTQVVESSSSRPTTPTNSSNSEFEVKTGDHITTTKTPAQTKTPVYSPVLLQAKQEENQTESKTEVNKPVPPSLALQEDKTEAQTNNSTKEVQHDTSRDKPVEASPFLDTTSKGVSEIPQEGLHFSDLIDRLFFTGNEEKKDVVGGSLQTDQLRPVYGQAHLYNATSLGGASVIESRYPVKENDSLQPVYGTVPAYHRPTAESSIGKVDSLRPRYGGPPSFREESSEELISHMHTQVSTTAEVHYEPALSLDADTLSDKKSPAVIKATNLTVENTKTQSDLSHQNNTAPRIENRPHISIAPKDLTPIYYDVRKYPTTTPSPASTYTTEDSSAHLSTLTTSATTIMLHNTSFQGSKNAVNNATTPTNTTKEVQEQHPNLEEATKPDYNIWELMFFNRSTPTVQSTKNDNTTENNIWKQMFFNHSGPSAEQHKEDNKTDDSNEITKKNLDHKKPAEEVAITTSVIKVRVGNTLNVSVDSSNQSKYRNVEEDGIIVSVYPEHQMDGGVTDLQDMPLPGQAESRSISSGDSFKSIQHSGDKAKSPAELTQVISDIIKAHKSEEPEVITAPNIDFSKPNVMTVKVSPSNTFKVFSLVLLDKNGTSERGTTSTTEPPVDNAPWAPMGSAAEDSPASLHSAEYGNPNQTVIHVPTSTESFESQASLTVQTQQLPSHAASETAGHSDKPPLHSTFRIVPFLAEDAIFRPATSTPSSLANDTGAYPRIVNTDPRDTIEDNCFVDGHMFANGELIKKPNPCELCRCYYGRELCQQKNCPLPPSPACISEPVPGFCCPKYTCRPEDVYFPPDSETTPGPDNQVQQYTVNIWSTRSPTGHFDFGGGHNAARQSQITGRKSTPRWPSTSSYSLKNSPTLKPYLLQRPSPHKTHDRFAHLHGAEEPDSDEETTPLPTTTTEPPTTSQSPSSSQQLWNIFEVSGCNIYGRLYGVNEVVRELSGKCKACTCTSLGVQCNETC